MLILCAKAAATVVLQNIATGICYATRGLITDGGENVLSSNKGEGVGLEYDAFGVSMFTSGSAQTPYRPAGLVLDMEGLDFSGPPVACPLYTNRALWLSMPCGGGDGTDWCKANKANPDPTKCQDCCDQKLMDILKKRLKKGGKEIARCMQNCLQEPPDDRADCFIECLVGKVDAGTFDRWAEGIKHYLECCYGQCDATGGHWDPPGKCGKKLP